MACSMPVFAHTCTTFFGQFFSDNFLGDYPADILIILLCKILAISLCDCSGNNVHFCEHFDVLLLNESVSSNGLERGSFLFEERERERERERPADSSINPTPKGSTKHFLDSRRTFSQVFTSRQQTNPSRFFCQELKFCLQSKLKR